MNLYHLSVCTTGSSGSGYSVNTYEEFQAAATTYRNAGFDVTTSSFADSKGNTRDIAYVRPEYKNIFHVAPAPVAKNPSFIDKILRIFGWN